MGYPRVKSRFAYTIDQYLAIEHKSDERYYYLDGEIHAMAGESGPHGDISVNIVVSLGNPLKGSPCRTRIECVTRV